MSVLARAGLWLQWLRDLTIGTFYIAIGNLLPKQHVPDVDLSGKTCIVTGANSGIGLELALAIARQGSTVYLGCRNRARAEEAMANITNIIPKSEQRLHFLELDTSSLKSVQACGEVWKSTGKGIDILFHNAGIGSTPPGEEVTSEGFGKIYATNFLGAFLLTSLLEPSLNNGARVVSTSSTGQYGGDLTRQFRWPKGVPQLKWLTGKQPVNSEVYSDSKAMQVAFTALLQQRFDTHPSLRSKGLCAHAFTPGYTETPIFGKMPRITWYADPTWMLLKNSTKVATPVAEGAKTGVWLATTNEGKVVGKGQGGGFWDRCVRMTTATDLMDKGSLQRLWDLWCWDSGIRW
ncbi:hypothetical protein MMC13_004682 [Lambiella insularis]|nr:hypothetical protein [Lambiella insularis]